MPVTPSGGRSSGGTRHTVSPRTRSGSRLVAMIRSHGHLASSSCTKVAQSPTWCSQVSRMSSMCRERSASASVCASGTPGSSRTPIVAATCWAMGPCQSASSTSHASSRSPGTPQSGGPDAVEHLTGEPDRQPGLADTAGPAQGQRPHLAEQPGQFGQIALTADKAIWLSWQVAAEESGGGRHRPSGGVTRGEGDTSSLSPYPLARTVAISGRARLSPAETTTGMASVYLTRPKYITFTSAHHCDPGRSVAGTVTANRRVVLACGAALKPCAHGPSSGQVPNGETS